MVCGCSIRVRGYLVVSYILGFRIMCRGIIRYMPRSVELPPRGAFDDVNDTTRALMITILPVDPGYGRGVPFWAFYLSG